MKHSEGKCFPGGSDSQQGLQTICGKIGPLVLGSERVQYEAEKQQKTTKIPDALAFSPAFLPKLWLA